VDPAPLVSVVIPAYNAGRYVEEAVDSVLAQTYPAVEILVVDDGSTDDTRERLDPYGDKIRYIRQDNAGPSAARNNGIRAARGRYVAFLDADDLFHPRRIELQVPVAEADPAVGLVASGQVEGDEVRWEPIPTDPIPVDHVRLEDLVLRSRFGTCGVLVRAECFAAVGVFDESLGSAEDLDMWMRIAGQYRVVRLRAPLWWYRPTPGSLSRHPDQCHRMRHFLQIALDKAFRMPQLAGRFSLRRKAMGMADLASCLVYREAGHLWTALGRLMRSFGWWPFWYRRIDTRGTLVRPRVLIATLRQAFSESISRRWNGPTPPV
jgi:glycosyltransferase involved in cell wall biosynthesis